MKERIRQMSGGTRWATLAAAVVLLALLLAAAPAAHGQEGAVEVRVAAQRLANGNTEFALQERQADGSWGERRLPRGRFFPASTRVGRWLGSSPLTIEVSPDSMSTAAGVSGLEVRVAAQLLADGRMEFALQEREEDGTWGERRLPRARYFPANAGVGRWLSSSSLTVSAPLDTMSAAATTPGGACVLANHVNRVTAATFQVQTATGTGTAFYIGSGEWITNHHVVETVSSASLVHGATRLNASVTGSLPNYDLALLGARPATSVPALAFAGTRPSLASDLMVVGFPAWVESTPSVTRGVVSKHAPFSTHYSGRAGTVIQVDAPVNPGNSGGPIVDNCGAVIGVATFGYDTTQTGRPVEGINFGVAAETVVAQLVGLRSSTHHARGSVTVTAPTSTTLEITALCNGDWVSSDDCQVAAASGLDTSDPGIWARGVEEWDNLYYSIDSLEGRDYLSLRELGRGRHTLQINERRPGGWTGWSQPYAFTVTGAAPLEIRAVCNGDWADYDTSDACFAAGSGGIRAERYPVIWTIGVSEWSNLQYSIDGGAAVARADFNLRNLSPGFHTIRVSEQQAAGWTGWSEPYAFTITGAAPLRVGVDCSRYDAEGYESSDDCRAETQGGKVADNFSFPVRGVVDWDNVRYSIDRGEAIVWEATTLRNLVPGRHQVRASEQQAAGWTGWSEPYWFTITGAASLEILAYCDTLGEGRTWEDCNAAPVTRGGRHHIWARGVVDFDNLRVSVDGGSGIAWDDLNLWSLLLGRHNIRIGEQQAAGWTGWSEPYWFTIRE